MKSNLYENYNYPHKIQVNYKMLTKSSNFITRNRNTFRFSSTFADFKLGTWGECLSPVNNKKTNLSAVEFVEPVRDMSIDGICFPSVSKFLGPNTLRSIQAPESKMPLGRWTINTSSQQIEANIDRSNEDNCGPCGYTPMELSK